MGIASNLGRIVPPPVVRAVSARCRPPAVPWRRRLEFGPTDLIEATNLRRTGLAEGQGLDWDAGKVNVNSGAIARGHPVDASGCRVLVSLLHEMLRRDVKRSGYPVCRRRPQRGAGHRSAE